VRERHPTYANIILTEYIRTQKRELELQNLSRNSNELSVCEIEKYEYPPLVLITLARVFVKHCAPLMNRIYFEIGGRALHMPASIVTY